MEEAILSKPITIKQLDGRVIINSVDEVITPQTLRRIQTEGMPIVKKEESQDNLLKTVDELSKGDMYVRFNIIFPKQLKNHIKDTIVQALRENEDD